MYATMFSDNDWYDNEYRAAANLDISDNHFAVRGQVTTSGAQPRRLIVEYSKPVTTDTAARIQLGRFVRLDGFYNNVTDSPSSSGMSTLPLATYNRRMNTGTFTIMDGIQGCGTTRLNNGLLEYGVRFGKVFIEDEDELQKEAFGSVVTRNLGIVKNYNNRDATIRYTTGNNIFLMSYNRYRVETKANSDTDFLAQYISTSAHSIIYDTIKVGALSKWANLELSSEYHYGKTTTYDKLGVETTRKDAHNIYVKTAYDIGDNWNVYALASRGMLESFPSWARDVAVGITWDNGKWMTNLEYHKGNTSHGGWVKYDAPSDKLGWNSWVASVVRRF